MEKAEIIYLLFLVFTLPVSFVVGRFGGRYRVELLGCLGFVVSLGLVTWVAHLSIAISGVLIALLPVRFVDKVVTMFVFGYLLPARLVFEADGATNAMLLITALRMVMFACDVTDGKAEKSAMKFWLYVYCVPGILTGPLIDTGSLFVNPKLVGQPSPDYRRACVVIAKGALWGVANLLLVPVFKVLKSGTLTGVETLAVLMVAPWYFRARCYFAWYLTEGAWSLLGVAGDVWGRNVLQDLGTERGLTVKEVTTNWNSSVQTFLGVYVFKRLKGIAGRRALTFILSAWWHGTEVALYLFFLGIMIGQWLESHYSFLLPKWLQWTVTNLYVNLLTAAFILKNDFSTWWKISAVTYHTPLLTPVMLAAVGSLYRLMRSNSHSS